jgi:hypothetical protein
MTGLGVTTYENPRPTSAQAISTDINIRPAIRSTIEDLNDLNLEVMMLTDGEVWNSICSSMSRRRKRGTSGRAMPSSPKSAAFIQSQYFWASADGHVGVWAGFVPEERVA